MSALGQAFLLHPPDRQFDPVLSEKRLTLEHQCWHAPMASGFQSVLVARNFLVQLLWARLGFGFQLGQIKPCARGSLLQMIALIPTLRPAPDKTRDFIGKFQPLPRRDAACPMRVSKKICG